VLVAEFDIDKGSVIRAQYPAPLDAAEDALAELMLPEGAHNHDADWTYFAIRPMLARHAADAPVRVECYVYRSSDGQAVSTTTPTGAWHPFCADETLSLTLEVEGEGRWLIVQAGRSERLRMRLHAELQYTVLQDDFVSCYAEDSTAVGLHFGSKDAQRNFSERLDGAFPDSDDGSTLGSAAAAPSGGGGAAGGTGGANSESWWPGSSLARSSSALELMVDARAEASSSPVLEAAPLPLVWVLNLVRARCCRAWLRARVYAGPRVCVPVGLGDGVCAALPARARACSSQPPLPLPPPPPPASERWQVCTRKDKRIRRGAEVKAIAVATTDRFLHAYKVWETVLCLCACLLSPSLPQAPSSLAQALSTWMG
jgi:hypothetical protein